jgi:hypothetical protein
MMYELNVVEANQCPACRSHHRFRVALTRQAHSTLDWSGIEGESILVGFFAQCPVTGRAAWTVLEVPDSDDGRASVLRVGPIDREEWEPDSNDTNRWAQRQRVKHSGAAALSPLPSLPRCGPIPSGHRDDRRVPETLRRALGCPIYT